MDSRPARGSEWVSREDVHIATSYLSETRPDLSASQPLWPWQARATLALCLSLTGMALLWPLHLVTGCLIVLSVSFLSVAALRIAALSMPRFEPEALNNAWACDSHDLPVYSVLVPLYREEAVLPDLVEALSVLSYPNDKLQIILIFEEADLETRDALARIRLPAHFETIIVPAGLPQTKPRALNAALVRARGTFVTVYDAEDVPEPDQLQKAVRVFQNTTDDLVCLQARLNIYNCYDTWLTRQFTLEYSALFDRILPALQWLTLPVPLGGTSNHFRRSALVEAGGWDPYNVTEDADLGIRFARAGRRVAVLSSTTWEEAPRHLSEWLAQRTRWLKGWIQTYLVHMRSPRRLLQDLGLFRFFGFQMLMGGLIVSALVHPLFYLALIASAWTDAFSSFYAGPTGHALWAIGTFNLVSGYATAVLLGMRSAVDRGFGRLAMSALYVPFYWLLISAAAYTAIVELIRAPHVWNKTMHSARTKPTGPVGS